MQHISEYLALRKAVASAQQHVEADFSLAYAHNQMGCAWMMAGDYQKGCELFQEALRIWKSNPMYKKGLASMEYANLGLSYWLLGQLDQASRILEEGLKEREEGFGVDNPELFRYTAMCLPPFSDMATDINVLADQAGFCMQWAMFVPVKRSLTRVKNFISEH